MDKTKRRSESELQHRLVQRIRVISRVLVLVNWLVMLVILLMHGVPKSLALSAFTVFKATAVCASLWFVIEIAEAVAGLTPAKNPLIDAVLTLPMFGFWFLAWASSF
jgi:hypothetical protein